MRLTVDVAIERCEWLQSVPGDLVCLSDPQIVVGDSWLYGRQLVTGYTLSNFDKDVRTNEGKNETVETATVDWSSESRRN